MLTSAKTFLAVMTISALLSFNALGDAVHFQSGVKQVSLIELYTSEGCSSCPPAEAWLNQLKESPELWKSFAPVAFHVDYWNSLGWKDRWSSGEYADRQRAYAQLWHSEDVYTPEFVLNGREWHNWLNLRGIPSVSGEDAGVLEIQSTNATHWSVNFTPAQVAKGGYEIHAALLAGGLDSAVKAGENRGRLLQHEFAVVEIVQLGMTTSNGTVHGKFLLDAAHHASEKVLAVTAWVTRAGELEPLQATGGWLTAPAAAR